MLFHLISSYLLTYFVNVTNAVAATPNQPLQFLVIIIIIFV